MLKYTGMRGEVGPVVCKLDPALSPVPSPLSPAASLKLINHSPDGFQWGYSGSGPAQLAFAILLDFTGNRDTATKRYQDFKRLIVSRMPNNWQLNAVEIDFFLRDSEVIVSRYFQAKWDGAER